MLTKILRCICSSRICLYFSVCTATSSRTSFFFGLIYGLILSLFLAYITSISSIRSMFNHQVFIASKSIRPLLELSSLKQMIGNSVEGYDDFDQRLQTVKSTMIDDAGYHNGKKMYK